jgi:tetratricopeptide (TPR) repeat protein
MTSHFAEIDFKTQQGVEELDFTAPGQLVLANLNIDSALAESTEISLWELSNYSAVEWWLADYKPKPSDTNLEKVRGYLEAFYHFCAVEDWHRGSLIIFTRLNNFTNQCLDKQLGNWGYYREQLDFYSKLLGKFFFEPELDAMFLIGMGFSYNELGEYEKALDCSQKCLEIAQKTKLSGWEINALVTMGSTYYYLGDMSNAIKYHQKSLALGQKGENHYVMSALLGLANAYQELGDYRKAIESGQQALEIAQEIKDRHAEGTVLGNMGSSYHCLGKPNKAIECHQKSLKIARETQSRRIEITALGNLSLDYCLIGKYSQAIEHSLQALEISKEIQNLSGEELALASLGAVYEYIKNYPESIKYYNQSLIIATQVQDRRRQGKLLFNLGNVYCQVKIFNKALDCYQKSLELAREELLLLKQSKTQVNNYRIEIPNYSPFVRHFLPDMRWIDRRGEAGILASIGNTYHHLGNYEAAIDYFQECLEILREINDLHLEAKLLWSMGNSYYNLENYEAAIESYNETLSIARQINDSPIEIMALKHLGASYYKIAGLYHLRSQHSSVGDYEKHKEANKNLIKYSSQSIKHNFHAYALSLSNSVTNWLQSNIYKFCNFFKN